MGKLLIFGGTTEGRKVAEDALSRGEDVTICVTSHYARALLPNAIDCHVGVLDEAAMYAFVKKQNPSRIIDATHPFAALVTKNIATCAQQLHIPLKRMERPLGNAQSWQNDVEWARDAQAAAEALTHIQGNVLLTTGSHTIDMYTAHISPQRLYARVLPTVQAIELCLSAGVLPSHIIAMHGPFSSRLNAALYEQLDISILVSKDSGVVGGVDDKVIPALAKDIHVILIKRPEEKHHAR